jgi:hypothetical protein
MTIGTWSITGTAGNVVTVNSSIAGSQRNVNLTNVTSGIDYLAVRDIAVNQANRFYVGANSTDNGNNSNVIFTAAPSGAQTLSPSLYTNDNLFYAQVVKGFNALAPPQFTNEQVFLAAAVKAVNTLSLSTLINTQDFYASNVAANNSLAPATLVNINQFYSAAVIQEGAGQIVAPARFDNTNTFFTASVAQSGGHGNTFRLKKRRPFKPIQLFPILPDRVDGKVTISPIKMQMAAASAHASGETIIFGLAFIATQTLISEMTSMSASSAWNDPTDDELVAIMELLL